MYFVIFRVKQQLFLDHSAVLSPNTLAPFVSVEDAVRHLLPYHTCARALPSQTDFISGSTPMEFEFDFSKVLSCIGPHCRQTLMKLSVIFLCSGQAVWVFFSCSVETNQRHAKQVQATTPGWIPGNRCLFETLNIILFFRNIRGGRSELFLLSSAGHPISRDGDARAFVSAVRETLTGGG